MAELRSLELRRVQQASEHLAAVFRTIDIAEWIGRSTIELDRHVQRELSRLGMQSALYRYRGYPAYSCISPNHIAVHGVPDERKIQRGDIVTVDIAAGTGGWMADGAWTYIAPGASTKSLKTVNAAWDVLRTLVSEMKADITLLQIAEIAQRRASEIGASIIPEFAGHGIGRSLHEPPQIPFVTNNAEKDTSPAIPTGTVVCIEPVVTLGSVEIEQSDDGFAYQSKDRSPVAYFELIVELHDEGCRVLTLPGMEGRALPENLEEVTQ